MRVSRENFARSVSAMRTGKSYWNPLWATKTVNWVKPSSHTQEQSCTTYQGNVDDQFVQQPLVLYQIPTQRTLAALLRMVAHQIRDQLLFQLFLRLHYPDNIKYWRDFQTETYIPSYWMSLEVPIRLEKEGLLTLGSGGWKKTLPPISVICSL